MIGKASLGASRVIEVGLILLGIAIFTADDSIAYILFWDLLAMIYLTVRVVRLKRSKRDTAMEWLNRGLGGRLGLIFTIATSVAGIVAGLTITLSDAADKIESEYFGVPCVLFAWAILHFGYAERYARDFYAADPDERPLAFPNIENPTFIEFAYFSFTLGTTFSVSDVETRTTAIRGRILAHSILSFVYNTATIGIAVSVLTG